MSSSRSKRIDKTMEKLIETREEIDKQANDLRNWNHGQQESSMKQKYEATVEHWKLKDKEDKSEDRLEKEGLPKRFY
ncbi:unnamed protein product [Withania somnifera]